MSYEKINWEDSPSTKTPINAENLNKMDQGIYDAHEELKKMIPTEQKGQPKGVASLDETGKVPEEQLPELGVQLGETKDTAFRGDYGKIAYDHAFNKGKPFAKGLYKITVNAEGHITDVSEVTKEDIINLGIPVYESEMLYSFTANEGAVASAYYGFVQGFDAKVTAYSACALGYQAEANGEFSYSLGRRTIADGHYQHIRGRYNIPTSRQCMHIVGNGTNVEHLSNAYTLDGSGNAWYQGSIQSTGSDYAEYFEWLDGNPDNEDRVGLLVTLDGEKIRLANAGDEILGIISGTVAVLGDNYEWEWNGKYLTDDFGRVIYDMVEEFVEIPHVEVDDDGNMTESIETKSLGFFEHPRINPNYDPEQEYVNRSDRPEWDAVGMLGKLFVRDDGTAQVNGYVTVGENGIATKSEEKTNMRVLSRVNENVVRVLLK